MILEMYHPNEDTFSNKMLDQFRISLQILQGCNLIFLRSGKCKSYDYCGPNIYQDWKRKEFREHREEFSLKRLYCPVSAEEMEEAESYHPPPAKSVLTNLFDGNSLAKFKYREEMTKSLDRSKLTKEQQRSLRYIHDVCNCGRNQRKKRCRKCEQCRAPPCGQCCNCLNPQRKQTCVGKVCLFPIIPNCRCFGK